MPKKENPYRSFISMFQKEHAKKETRGYLSITSDNLNKEINLESLLGNYAHGNVRVSKNDVINMSCLTGDILETYFKAPKE
jgi:hypothetical protein